MLLVLFWSVGSIRHYVPEKNTLFLALSLFALSTNCFKKEKNT